MSAKKWEVLQVLVSPARAHTAARSYNDNSAQIFVQLNESKLGQFLKLLLETSLSRR
jgi:hypothetical protein